MGNNKGLYACSQQHYPQWPEGGSKSGTCWQVNECTKCGLSLQWNAIQPLKRRRFWPLLAGGWALRTLCEVRQGGHKKQILYSNDVPYTTYLESSNSWRRKGEWRLPGSGGRGNVVLIIEDTEFQFCKMNSFCRGGWWRLQGSMKVLSTADLGCARRNGEDAVFYLCGFWWELKHSKIKIEKVEKRKSTLSYWKIECG